MIDRCFRCVQFAMNSRPAFPPGPGQGIMDATQPRMYVCGIGCS